jgi:DNA-directed RNA polymerase subunit RPC12/RpoP
MKKAKYHCKNCGKKVEFTVITTGHDIMMKKGLCPKCYIADVVKQTKKKK